VPVRGCEQEGYQDEEQEAALHEKVRPSRRVSTVASSTALHQPGQAWPVAPLRVLWTSSVKRALQTQQAIYHLAGEEQQRGQAQGQPQRAQAAKPDICRVARGRLAPDGDEAGEVGARSDQLRRRALIERAGGPHARQDRATAEVQLHGPKRVLIPGDIPGIPAAAQHQGCTEVTCHGCTGSSARDALNHQGEHQQHQQDQGIDQPGIFQPGEQARGCTRDDRPRPQADLPIEQESQRREGDGRNFQIEIGSARLEHDHGRGRKQQGSRRRIGAARGQLAGQRIHRQRAHQPEGELHQINGSVAAGEQHGIGEQQGPALRIGPDAAVRCLDGRYVAVLDVKRGHRQVLCQSVPVGRREDEPKPKGPKHREEQDGGRNRQGRRAAEHVPEIAEAREQLTQRTEKGLAGQDDEQQAGRRVDGDDRQPGQLTEQSKRNQRAGDLRRGQDAAAEKQGARRGTRQAPGPQRTQEDQQREGRQHYRASRIPRRYCRMVSICNSPWSRCRSAVHPAWAKRVPRFSTRQRPRVCLR